jgi:hypothetical protein
MHQMDKVNSELTASQWIVRGRLQRRRESKLYLVNCFGMLLPYAAVVVFVFISYATR